VRIWRLLGAALAVPVMLGGLLLVTAGPAAACTCVQMTEAQHAASANAVFVGALVDSRVDPSVLTRKYRQARLKERDARSTFRNLDPVALTFEVSRVYKGAVGKRQEIVIPRRPPGAGPAGSMFPRVRGRGFCSRISRQMTTRTSSIPASTSRPSRPCALEDPGRWLTVVNRPLVGRRPVSPAGRTAGRPRPVSLLAPGSWPQGSRPA
jgi:hypothetical protein